MILNSQVTALKGNDFLEAVDVKNKVSGETVTFACSWSFCSYWTDAAERAVSVL